MGLDLLIREQTELKVNKEGRNTYTVTELANFRNCWSILEELSRRLEGGFQNCGTFSFDEGTFHAILKSLKEEFKEGRHDLIHEIKYLEKFIEDNNLKALEPIDEENYGKTFEVHAWW